MVLQQRKPNKPHVLCKNDGAIPLLFVLLETLQEVKYIEHEKGKPQKTPEE